MKSANDLVKTILDGLEQKAKDRKDIGSVNDVNRIRKQLVK